MSDTFEVVEAIVKCEAMIVVGEELVRCNRDSEEGLHCILHLNDRHKNLERFEGELKTALESSDLDAIYLQGTCFPQGFVEFPKEITRDLVLDNSTFYDKCSFDSIEFNGTVSFCNAKFHSEIDFSRAHFRSVLSFDSALLLSHIRMSAATVSGEFSAFQLIVEGAADFSRSFFEEEADFRGCQISGTCDFSYSQFYNGIECGGSEFGSRVWFTYSEMNGSISFKGAKFKSVSDFENVSFLDGVNFQYSHFVSEAYFGNSTFHKDASFLGSIFGSECSFSTAHFRSRAYFANTRFQGSSKFISTKFDQLVSFEGVRIESGSTLCFDGELEGKKLFKKAAKIVSCSTVKDSVVLMRKVNLSRVWLMESDLSNWAFVDVEWPTISGFIRIAKRDCVYDELVECSTILGNVLPKSTEAKGASGSFLQAAQVYRNLQENYSRVLRYSEAGDFYIGEQEMRRMAKGPIRRYLSINNAYRALSYYGQNYVLPIVWLITSLFSFSLYFLLDGVVLTQIGETTTASQINYDLSWQGQFLLFDSDFWNVFWTNLSFLSLNRGSTAIHLIAPYQQGVVVLESILVFVLVTLFVLALSRQFKRKSF